MKLKLLISLFSIVVFLLILLPIILYFLEFNTHILDETILSNKKEEWAQFGDFLNVFVSMASLLLISFLTYAIYRYQRKDESNKSIPILIFKVDPKKREWIIQNVGKGVALNILISYSQTKNVWEKPTKIYSLVDGSEMFLTWFKPSLECIATYSDYLGNKFTSICRDDDTEFTKGLDELKDFKNNYFRLEEVGNKSYSSRVDGF